MKNKKATIPQSRRGYSDSAGGASMQNLPNGKPTSRTSNKFQQRSTTATKRPKIVDNVPKKKTRPVSSATNHFLPSTQKRNGNSRRPNYSV